MQEKLSANQVTKRDLFLCFLACDLALGESRPGEQLEQRSELCTWGLGQKKMSGDIAKLTAGCRMFSPGLEIPTVLGAEVHPRGALTSKPHPQTDASELFLLRRSFGQYCSECLDRNRDPRLGPLSPEGACPAWAVLKPRDFFPSVRPDLEMHIRWETQCLLGCCGSCRLQNALERMSLKLRSALA